MKVRLGFAVAAQMEPDVLIIDEVLAVGDVSFRAKCYERISELMQSCCVIFVTHSMPQIGRISSRVIHLSKGMIDFDGIPSKGIQSYYDYFSYRTKKVIDSKFLTNFKLEGIKKQYSFSDSMEFILTFDTDRIWNNVEINIVLLNSEEIPVCQLNTLVENEMENIILKNGYNELTFKTDSVKLATGSYYISLTVFCNELKRNLIWLDKVKTVSFSSGFIGVAPYLLPIKNIIKE